MMQTENGSLFIVLVIAAFLIGLAVLPVEIGVEDIVPEEEVLPE